MEKYTWVRPNVCGESACAEVQMNSLGHVLVRNSKSPAEHAMFDPEEWENFKQAIRAGEYD